MTDIECSGVERSVFIKAYLQTDLSPSGGAAGQALRPARQAGTPVEMTFCLY
ncbi:MAG: hypothetical protein P8048_14380 [Calditrichia bacterium]